MTGHMDETTKVIVAALEDPTAKTPEGFIAELMSANFRDYSNTVNLQVELLQKSLADREAELAAIRVRINDLFAGPYMPTETAIMMAVFHPSKELLQQMRGGES